MLWYFVFRAHCIDMAFLHHTLDTIFLKSSPKRELIQRKKSFLFQIIIWNNSLKVLMAQYPRKIIGFAQYFYVLSGLMGILFDIHVSDTKFISILNRQQHLWSIVLLTLLPNSLYRAERFANFEGVIGFFVPSIISGGPPRK